MRDSNQSDYPIENPGLTDAMHEIVDNPLNKSSEHRWESLRDISIMSKQSSEILIRILPECPDDLIKLIFQEGSERGDTDLIEASYKQWQGRLFFQPNTDSHPIERILRSDQFEWCDSIHPDILKSALSAHTPLKTVQRILDRIPLSHIPDMISEESFIEADPNPVTDLLKSHLIVALSANGNETYRRGEFELSVEFYIRALKLLSHTSSPQKEEDDDIVKLEYNVSRALYRSNRLVQSLEHCNRCLAIKPEYINALSQRAQTYASLEAYEEAKSDLQKIITIISSSTFCDDGSQLFGFQHRLTVITDRLSQDHYSELGLEKFSSIESIKLAYRQLARKFHPDKVMGENEDIKERSRNQFQRIHKAYETLIDSHRKSQYDNNLEIVFRAKNLRKSLIQDNGFFKSQLSGELSPERPRASPSPECIYREFKN